jgi:GlpG protein
MSGSQEKATGVQPVTGLLAASSVAVTIWWWSGGDVSVFTLDFRVWSEPWRLFTSVLPHVDLIHLIFNIYWLYVFGNKVEVIFGSVKTAMIYLFVGIGSSLAEYALARSGVGLSGIGYGLFGFLWVLSRNDSRFTDVVTHQVVLLFVVWFLLCIALTLADVWQVGNVAHGAGAVLGCVLGWCVVARTSDTRTASRLLLFGVFTTVVLVASLGRPYLNWTGIVAEENAHLGYQALKDGNAERAVEYLEKAVEAKPDESVSWFNLGIAYSRCERFDDAIRTYERASELSPSDEGYVSALSELKTHVAARRPRDVRTFASNKDENFIPVHLLASGAVQMELGLTVEQMAKINEMVQFAKKQLRETADMWQEKPAGSTGPLPEAREQELKEWIIGAATKGKELQATAVGSLTPSQHARLRQIQTQYAMAIVLLQPSVIQSLSISDAQLDTIRPHARELVLANADLVKGWDIPKDELERICPPSKLVAERGLAELLAFDGLSSQQILARMIDRTKEREKAMAEANRLALVVLTVEQRTKLEEFVGKQIEINWDYDALFRGD